MVAGELWNKVRISFEKQMNVTLRLLSFLPEDMYYPHKNIVIGI